MNRVGPVSVVELAKPARRERDREIANLAARQHGLVTHPQLCAIGLRPATIRARRARGQLIAVHHAVYAVGCPPLTPHGHWLAAVLACGPDAVLSHASAGALAEIRLSSATTVDVTILTRAGRCRPGISVHRADRLAPDQVTMVRGIPTTTVARTILDLAGVLSPGALEYTIHQAQIKNVLDRAAVIEGIAASPRRRGTARVRRILGLSLPSDDELNSMLARRMSRLVARAGLPDPLVDHWVVLPGGGGYEVDFCWPDRRLIVEADGRATHDTARGFENDRRRDRLLRLAGWTVVRYTWRDVTESGDEVITELAQLGRRGGVAPAAWAD